MTVSVAAVDLGASSGRVVVARVGPGVLELDEAYRFPNDPVTLPDGLHWDILRLYREVIEGLRRAARLVPSLASVGVDGWGVDYGLLDKAGRLLGNPYHYRDGRTALGVERTHAIVPHERLYSRTGIQFLPLNTVYQLMASLGTAELAAADAMLMLPDLMGYWLAGGLHVEATNASTSNLFDPVAGTWALDVVDELGLPRSILPPLVHAGDPLGALRPAVAAEAGLPRDIVLTAVGSHDTASAVVGIPAQDERFAYISCGTWGLVGVELGGPILSPASEKGNFTNELGVDGRIRYLRNVMGLWLLQELILAAGSGKTVRSSSGHSSPPRPRFRPPARSSMSTTRHSCRRATCRPGSRPIARPAAGRSRPPARPSSAASSRALPWRSPGASPTPDGSPGTTSPSSTWSAAVAATSCCAS